MCDVAPKRREKRRSMLDIPCHRIVGIVWALALVSGISCSDLESATDLNPQGPPMIRQVLLTERYVDSAGASLTRPVIAFGTHPDATANEQHPSIAAITSGQRFRVVIDELLVGNYLEEIKCNERVDDDFFSPVPLGATPDDIAKCAVVKEQLPRSCKGSKAVCVREDGVPVGIQDQVDSSNRPYKDGIADVTRMIAGVAGVQCGELSVAMDLERSYWQPSGNQQRPAIDDGLRGLLSLGPAVVLVPQAALPSGQQCRIVFADAVVDKSGLQTCAPPDGDITASCSPGDTTATTFTTEVAALLQQSPRNDTLGFSRTGDIEVRANITLAPTVQITSAPEARFTVTQLATSSQGLRIRPTEPLAPATRYVITIPLRDPFGFGSPMPAQVTFTTAN